MALKQQEIFAQKRMIRIIQGLIFALCLPLRMKVRRDKGGSVNRKFIDTINKTRREGMDNFVQKALRVEVLNNLMRTRMEQIGMKIPDDPNSK